jgi:predicted acyltransferase
MNIPVSGTAGVSLKTLIYENLFASWAGALHGMFIYALAFCWTAAAVLCWKKIFIKV